MEQNYHPNSPVTDEEINDYIGRENMKPPTTQIVLLTLLFGLPFVKVNGDPVMLIDVFERKFIIFGIHLWPQDFHIVALSMISLVVFVVLFTIDAKGSWL